MAQIEEVIVETYYISDINDESDTTGGVLEEGSVTYRIFIDLDEGNLLRSVYGDQHHALEFFSTDYFFNNLDRGKSYGYEIKNNSIDEHTAALDTWLTLGFATKIHLGATKDDDTDGSIVGGVNNDGGSSEIAGGLLVNNDPDAGIPLTTSDGLMPNTIDSNNISNFFAIGIEQDTTIFWDESKTYNSFSSNNTMLMNNPGIRAADQENRILVAQLTTKGDSIAFRLNIQVQTSDGEIINYVSDTAKVDSLNLYIDPPNNHYKRIYSPWLKYPFKSGCLDPHFIEYDFDAVIHDQDVCQDSIVFGCLDPEACNYDPDVNWELPELCCYGPDSCDGRDITIVCPGYVSDKKSYDPDDLILYPNPATDILNIELNNTENTIISFAIFDPFGKIITEKYPGNAEDHFSVQINISNLKKGLYLYRLFTENYSYTKKFIKIE